jgi:hypothetical protein
VWFENFHFGTAALEFDDAARSTSVKLGEKGTVTLKKSVVTKLLDHGTPQWLEIVTEVEKRL